MQYCGGTLPADPEGARLAEKAVYTKIFPFWSTHVSCQSTGASLPSALFQVPSALVTCVGARGALLDEEFNRAAVHLGRFGDFLNEVNAEHRDICR